MEITDESFDEVIAREDVAVVGFGAPWCGNCRSFLPVLEEAADKLQLPFYQLVADDNPDSLERFDVHPVPVRYDVKGVPTVIVFEGGKEKGRFVGALPQRQLVKKIKQIVS